MEPISTVDKITDLQIIIFAVLLQIFKIVITLFESAKERTTHNRKNNEQ